MKKYYTLICVLITAYSYSQNACWDIPNTPTTDPTKSNTVNSWDWRVQNETMYLKAFWDNNTNACLPQVVSMPMFPSNTAIATNKNLLNFQSIATLNLKDHQPQDGWELLAKDFGATGGFNNAVENPFYALYNRYTGKIRAFFMLTKKSANLNNNGARLTLSFANGARNTALFQHLEPLCKTIVNFDPENSFNVPNFIANEDFYWFYADFQTAYDPCTCQDIGSTKISQIEFGLYAGQNYSLNATINNVSISQQVSNVAGLSQPGSTDKNAASNMTLEQTMIEAGKKGYEYYNTWNGYKATANNTLDQLDAYAKGKINEQLQKEYPNGLIINGISYPNPTVNDLKNSEVGSQILLGKDYNANNLDILKGISSAIPYVGAVYGVFDYLVNVTKSQDITQVQQPPTVSQANLALSLSGSIQGDFPLSNKTINAPGHTNNSNTNFKPIYNNILGVVNVMDIPNFEYNELKPMNQQGQNIYQVNDGFIAKIRQYRFSDDIKYVINPASNMTVLGVESSIVLEYDDDIIFRQVPNFRDVDQMPVEFGDHTQPSFNINSPLLRMEKAGWELEYLSKDYFNYLNSPGSPIVGIYRIRTPYTKMQCAKDLVFNLFNHSEVENPNLSTNTICCRNKAPKILLKLIFTLKRNDQTIQDGIYTQVQTFDVSDKLRNAINTSSGGYYRVIENSTYKYAQGFITGMPYWPSIVNAPDNVILENTTLTSDVYAKNEIIIKNNVFHQNSFVNLIAGNKISTQSSHSIISNATGLPANIIYTTGKVKSCTNNTDPKANNSQILNACTSNKYKDRANASKLSNIENANMLTQFGKLEVALSPNPNQGNFNLSVNQIGKYNYSIFDVTGRLVYENSFVHTGDILKHNIVCENCLISGLYLVRITHGDEVLNQKIVISK